MAEIRAQLNYLKMSPRKVRLAADLIRGLPVEQAKTQLIFLQKIAALPLRKLLASALANARHNFGLEESDLYVKELKVDGGSMLKRWTPKAFGRAAPIHKHSSHISLTLGTKKNIAVTAKKQIISAPEVASGRENKIAGGGRPTDKTKGGRPDLSKKQGFLRKMFQRKAI